MVLSLQKVIKGARHREEVFLPFYDDSVPVRPLTDIEFNEARSEVDLVAMSESLGTEVKQMANTEDIEKIKSSIDLKKVDIRELDKHLTKLFIALARRGICVKELRQPIYVKEMEDGTLEECNPDEDGAERTFAVALLRGGSLELIGMRILSMTTTTKSELENFSPAPTEI